MRAALVLVLATMSSCGSTTLTRTDASTRTPTQSPAPVRASATASPSVRPTANAQIRYVAIGASDSVGVGAADPGTGSWPARVAALLPPGSVYRNVAISGSLTDQARREQLPTALRERPTVVSVWLAVNDLNADIPPSEHAAELAAIVDALVRGTGARVFVGTVPDLRAVPAYAGADPAALIARVDAYNAGITAVASARAGRVVVVDLFTGSAALTGQITVSADGFHPSDAGYALIAERFADAMRATGVPLSR